MKTLSVGLDSHLNQEVTTLTTCWRIERTDGVILGFTSLDTDIEFNGITYESEFGYSRTAISGGSDMSVDNVDVTGVFDSERITNEDLRSGAYNHARVYIFLLNYEDVTQGELALRTGWFGEVTLSQRGEFVAELRGLFQALSHTTIEVYTPECRTDFCDSRCKLNPKDFTRRATVLAATTRRDQFRASALPKVPGATSAGSHRIWGIKLLQVPDTKFGGFADVRFYDQNLAEITGGDTNADTWDGKHKPSKARDGNMSTYWVSDDDLDDDEFEGKVWWVEFKDPVDVKEVAMSSSPTYLQSPTRFALVYGIVDGNGKITGWAEVQTYTNTWTAAGQTALWGVGQPGSEPLSKATGASTIPAPFEGASTYIGGQVTFITGANRGKSMEILGYDSSQNITLFEGMPFPIMAGDTFDIMQGCNKDRATCKLYDNIINFRGEPDVPGQDEFLKYPDSNAG